MSKNNEYALEEQITVLTNKTVDILLQENPDALALYMFFIRSSKKQETNQPYATMRFCMKGLKWGRKKYENARDVLLKYKLIEFTQSKKKSGKFGKSYVKVNYLWKKATLKEVNRVYQKPQAVPPTDGFRPQMLKVNKLNALSKNNEMLSEAKQFLKEFNEEWDKSYRTTKGWIKNFTYWREDYSFEEILKAMKRAKNDRFYGDKLTPDMLFRTHEDRIGLFLNTGEKEQIYEYQGDYYKKDQDGVKKITKQQYQVLKAK